MSTCRFKDCARPARKGWTRSIHHIRTGDYVREIDGRHVGRVEAIYGGLGSDDLWAASALVTVRWENGWKSQIDLDELQFSED